jgi:hypothetical protein
MQRARCCSGHGHGRRQRAPAVVDHPARSARRRDSRRAGRPARARARGWWPAACRAPAPAAAAPRTGRACRGAPAREDVGGGAAFDHRAAVHHQHALHGVGHHAQVVADQQQAHAVLAHQFGDQVQHLALDGHVQRGGGLVGDQQVGPAGQRDGDHHALALAARELVRVGVEPLARPAAAARAAAGAAPRHAPRRAQALVQAQRLGDLPAHRVQRVQRRHRLLEDHADARAAQRHSASSSSVVSSCRRSGSSPPTCAPSGSRPISASAVIDLPQPDSPIRPTVSPRCDRDAQEATRRATRRPGRGAGCCRVTRRSVTWPSRSLPPQLRRRSSLAIERFLIERPGRRLVQYSYLPREPFALRHAERLRWRRLGAVWGNAPPAWVWELGAAQT